MSYIKKIENVLIGSDPEIIVTDMEGCLVASFLTGIKGGKEDPQDFGSGTTIQCDNVMVEYTVPPTNNPADMFKSIQYCLAKTEKTYGVKIDRRSSAIYPKEILNFKKAKEFGCEPDYNTWSLDINPQPAHKIKTFRSAGGHIHVSYANATAERSIELCRALDLFVGVPSVFLDTDLERKKLYGKAGAFRPKSYGVEYRTPSNWWIWEQETIELIFKQITQAVEFLNVGSKLDPATDGQMIQKCINMGNQEVALQLHKQYDLQIPGIALEQYIQSVTQK